jgi:hypothetical protein
MTDIDELAAAYEYALQAHWDDPDDEELHADSVDAAESLAAARKMQREADIAAGTRSAGVGVVADTKGDA